MATNKDKTLLIVIVAVAVIIAAVILFSTTEAPPTGQAPGVACTVDANCDAGETCINLICQPNFGIDINCPTSVLPW